MNRKELDKKEISEIISGLLMEIIEQHSPFHWILTIEEFVHPYKAGKISRDYSGDVKPMTKKEFKEIISDLGEKHWHSSKLEELLSSMHIGRWEATYISNNGRHWVSFEDLLYEKYNEWQGEKFVLYDKDGNDVDEELNMELNEILYDFIEDTPHEIYARKIFEKWFDNDLSPYR